MKKYIFYGIISLTVVYFTSIIVLYFAQEQLIFRSYELEDTFEFTLENKFEELYFQTSNQGKIHAIKLKADSSLGVILYFHGNLDNLSRWASIVEPLMKYNYDIVALDYRGYGKSYGKRTSEFMYQDAVEVYDEISLQYDTKEIVVFGRSLGSTFATYVASQRESSLLILETPFYSMTSIVEHFYPFLPAHHFLKYRFPSYAFIEKVKTPAIFLQGNADLIVPYENALSLYHLAPNAKWVHFEGGGHNDLSNYPLYWETLDSLFNF